MWSAPACHAPCHAPWLLLVNSVADFALGRQKEGSRFFRLKAAARTEQRQLRPIRRTSCVVLSTDIQVTLCGIPKRFRPGEHHRRRGSSGCLGGGGFGGLGGSGAPPGKRNGQYRHGDRTKAAIAEQQKFSALLKMLRAGLT